MKILFIVSILTSIFSQIYAQKDQMKCEGYYEKGFKEVTLVPIEVAVGLDSLKIYEMRFTCISPGINSQIAVYNKFGKWDKVVNSKNENELPTLIWENETLFKNNDQKYGCSEWISSLI